MKSFIELEDRDSLEDPTLGGSSVLKAARENGLVNDGDAALAD